MKSILYVTGNPRKIEEAQRRLKEYDVEVEQYKIDLEEIQSDSFEEVALNKAKKAFAEVGKPLFVNDSAWAITALNGFPGPYMKYVNQCFSPEDFIALLSNHENKEVILKETIVYIDESNQKVFSYDHKGVIVDRPRGEKAEPSAKVMSLSESGKTIAEEADLGINDKSSDHIVWKKFGEWLSSKE